MNASFNSVKRMAIAEVDELIKKGFSKSKALAIVAKKYGVYYNSLKYAYEHDYIRLYRR